jgi:hypothetical protein
LPRAITQHTARRREWQTPAARLQGVVRRTLAMQVIATTPSRRMGIVRVPLLSVPSQ